MNVQGFAKISGLTPAWWLSVNLLSPAQIVPVMASAVLPVLSIG
jgi:hypothetical protein